jgi:hypothetical protein
MQAHYVVYDLTTGEALARRRTHRGAAQAESDLKFKLNRKLGVANSYQWAVWLSPNARFVKARPWVTQALWDQKARIRTAQT